ncbi:MAG: GNAT family N-acetyltransferase [Gemmatimonadales bacterium]|nr:GNAT family N-acetyltransferase [Gemmatimonadales bacterium]
MEWIKGSYRISDAKVELDIFYIISALQESYWAVGREQPVVEESIKNSVCLGLYTEGRQIGFARAVTDKCTFAWICDVMVHEDYRGAGLGKWLTQCLSEHPEVKACRQHLLRTRDAHGLYEQFGYSVCEAMVRKQASG